MEYKVNPSKIFIDKCVKTNEVSKENKHTIEHERCVIFTANKKFLPYYDHIETSGNYSSLIYQYGADINKNYEATLHMVFPTFRRKPDETRSSFCVQVKDPLEIYVNKTKYTEKLKKIILDGFINVHLQDDGLEVIEDVFCPDDFPGVIINYYMHNKSKEEKHITIKNMISRIQCDDNYLTIPYQVEAFIYSNKKRKKVYDRVCLAPNEKHNFSLVFRCKYDEDKKKTGINPNKSFTKRYVKLLNYDMLYHVNTKNTVIDTMFHLSKIRASESICETECGLLHSPGGGNYYAAIWTNDQCEYAAPLFAYFGVEDTNVAILNSFLQYEKYMYTKNPLVTSIIAEGRGYWNGAKDRGDAAMYAYGLANFLLTKGDHELAEMFLKQLKWCIEYSLKKKNEYGVIMSDSDELENRFESGNCNLATNAILYQALLKTAAVFKEFALENNYEDEAFLLKESINKYFYDNGRCIYCKEETHLRSHVVYPLIMGIYDHTEDIVKTIMDERLYTENGFKTIDNCETYWDRITLMAIRGLFNADKSNLAYEILNKYSENRLLKDHVPYAIEAYPEGNQAHLAAESALYARIFLEGLFGYEPLSFTSFKLHLSIPDELSDITIENLYICKTPLSISVTRIDEDSFLLDISELLYFKKVKNHTDIIINVADDILDDDEIDFEEIVNKYRDNNINIDDDEDGPTAKA